ncbi:MAG: hypothetical protein Kow00103_12770 [Candidatus Caldatribacteriota bacterium]
MSEFNLLGRILLFLGIFLVFLGVVFLLAGKFSWPGKLPGDILIQRKNFVFYFPLGLCILLSIILTLIARIFRH